MKKTATITLAVVAGILVAASLYFSPHYTLYQMKQAVENQNADEFSEHVSYPDLRESFKAEMNVIMAKQMNSPEMQDNPFAAFGHALVVGYVEKMADALITPQGLRAMWESGEMPQEQPDGADQPQSVEVSSAKDKEIDYSIDYKDWDRVLVVAKKTDADVSFVMKRDGLWSWKLAEIRFPKKAFE